MLQPCLDVEALPEMSCPASAWAHGAAHVFGSG